MIEFFTPVAKTHKGYFKSGVSLMSGLTPLMLLIYYSNATLSLEAHTQMGALLIILTLFLGPVLFISSVDFKSPTLFVLMLALMMFVIACFLVDGLLMFYILFELMAIPMAMIIMGWGSQPERLTATIYMLLYTVVSSLPFILIILSMSPHIVSILWLLIIPFMVKLPAYMAHVWLPKAHVEAPVYGSMILAAILLKVGVFGIYRVGLIIPSGLKFSIGALVLTGATLVSFIVLGQFDLKALIAYSSVVHMGAILGPVLFISSVGLTGGLLMSLAHGVVSSGLFYCVTLQYYRAGGRSITSASGCLVGLPLLTMLWSLLVLSNLSAPPSVSLFSELLMFNYWVSCSALMALTAGLLIMASLMYSLILFLSISHGSVMNIWPFSCVSVSEYLILALHSGWLITGMVVMAWVV